MSAAGGGAARRRRSRGSRLRLALVLLVILLLSAEIVVRVGGFVHLDAGASTPEQAAFNAADMFVASDDAALGYRNKPGARTVVAGVEYLHDEHGWRVMPPAARAPDDAMAKADGGAAPPEVIFLGDSTTYGLGLAAADTLPAQVAAALGGRITPRDLGVCAYGTAQEARLYEQEFSGGRRAGAPLVVLVLYPNDFARGTFLWDSRLHLMYVDPLPLPLGLKQALWRSATYRALVSAVTTRMKAEGVADALDPRNESVPLAAVERLARAVAADGRKLLVAHLPAMEALDPYVFAQPVAHLRETCQRIGVPFVDLLDGFLAEREVQAAAYAAQSRQPASELQRRGFLARYWINNPADHHLNAAANRIAAQQLARAIEPLLPH